MTLAESRAAGGQALKEYLAAYRSAPDIEEEITMATKNADMNIVNHVFGDTPGETSVMLDPVSPFVRDLFDMQQHDEGYKEAKYVIKNYMKMGNTQLKRKGPAGILIPSAKWK